VRKLNEAGTTVLLTTQYLEEADQLASRIAIIDQGRIVRRGTPTELKAQLGSPTLEVDVAAGQEEAARTAVAGLGEPRADRGGGICIGLPAGAAEMAGVVRALDDAGVTVERVELHQPTLDDVFADATGRRLEGAEDTDAVAGATP
jgi:ABC-2 type transport system ATP-binding protein